MKSDILSCEYRRIMNLYPDIPRNSRQIFKTVSRNRKKKKQRRGLRQAESPAIKGGCMMAKKALKFEIHYDDGSVAEVEHGLLLQMSDFDENGKATLVSEAAGMTVVKTLAVLSAASVLAEKMAEQPCEEDVEGEESAE